MIPEWRKIPGKPSRYEISREGVVITRSYDITYMRDGKKCTRTQPQAIIKQRLGRAKGSHPGHPVVGIYVDYDRTVETRVSTMVAKAYLGCPYPNDSQTEVQKWRIRFKDGDQLNVHADNLEWVPNAGCNGTYDAQARYEKHLVEYRGKDAASTISWLFDEDAA